MITIKVVRGVLEPFFEQGTEGIWWSLEEPNKDGYDGLNTIDEGDYLIIYSGPLIQVWSGYINPDYRIGNTYSHWIQMGVKPHTWAHFFFTALQATLIKFIEE